MRKIITIAFSCCCIIACKNGTKSNSEAKTEADKAKEEKKISSRDYNINSSNAYNNLQLDSMTVAKFIADKGFPDSIVKRITSFYNARNYYYAWFSTDGLTEQTLGFWNLHNYESSGRDTSLEDNALH